jgi:large conductance mechanosensitive channel
MFKGFKNFLLRGDVVVVAVGLVIALAFSTLIKAFTSSVVTPIVSRAEGTHSLGLGWQLGSPGDKATFVNAGTFVSAVIYFLIFMAVVYFAIVLPYKVLMARRGKVVFGEPAPTKTCPACLSDDLPVAASKCKYCATEQPPSMTADSAEVSSA